MENYVVFRSHEEVYQTTVKAKDEYDALCKAQELPDWKFVYSDSGKYEWEVHKEKP